MALTNNTKFRRTTLTINKKVNGALVTTGGFPVTVSVLDSFTDPATSQVYAALTGEQFSLLSDPQYNARLTAFYNHLENTYSFFQRTSVQNTASGTDAVLCPLNNTVPAQPVISSINLEMIAISSSGLPNHLAWTIAISAPSTVDLNYNFNVEFKDTLNQTVRAITVTGIMPAGVTALDSYSSNGEAIYIIEADTTQHGPLNPTVVPGSESLFA